ncbi:hypothetical protein BH20ACI4_BH20ACI4_21410 [soil metagenome]
MRKNLSTDRHGCTRIRKLNLRFQISNFKFRNSNSKFTTLNTTLTIKNLYLSVFICGLFFLIFSKFETRKTNAEVAESEIEKAIFTKQEFFGASANVPLPTAKARENLLKLAESQPDNRLILEKLAEANEKLERFDEAEKVFKHLSEIDGAKLYDLADFYERRGRFDEQGEVLHKILKTAPPENRVFVFEKLLATARRHDLKKYLSANFFAETAKANPDVYGVFVRLIENLEKEENYAEALNFVRRAKIQFPEHAKNLLEKEVEFLLELEKPREAEAVYQAAFDPFWSVAEAQNFYDFLSGQDRLRAYGSEIAARFKADNADFDAAIRLALYRDHDYRGGNEDISPIILKLEKAKKDWTTGELVTATRLLLKNGDGAYASRFLYTLYLREDFKNNSEFRAKIIYQLFEMFSDTNSERLPLTKGDLSFYEDITQADTHPGISTGILSLIFSDTNPREKLEEQETLANEKFNRAAAYRIFEEYKKENPNSPELAQMYLDIVRLYAAAMETEIAEKTLNEFAGKYSDSKDFADAALKLADAYTAVKNEEKACEIYQKILDHLGKQRKFQKAESRVFFAENFSNAENENNFETPKQVSISGRNDGINIPNTTKKKKDDYYYDEPEIKFNDYLARDRTEIFYDEILEKLVASLSNEKKTSEILAVYSQEITKYPNEEWLCRQRLEWLEKTNLAEAKLEVYKTALARFKTNEWRDKLARFFIREKRDAEFAEFSEDLTGKLEDADVRYFLTEFIDGKLSGKDFDRQLYFKLYESAHRRFPHNQNFVAGLLRFYKHENMTEKWRELAAEYYFEFPEIRQMFLDDLAGKNDLRNYLKRAEALDNTIYTLFRADASIYLSNFENAVAAYQKLNELYPHTPEFSEKLISLTRSFGQKNFQALNESANYAKTEADFSPTNQNYRTRSGEIFAETGDYEKSNTEWAKLIPQAIGEKEIYLDAATVYWDYFQYPEALETIKKTRVKFADDSLYAFESGAIYEAKHQEKQAVREYVKALGVNDEDERQKERSKKRLVYLSRKSPEILPAIDAAFAAEKRGGNTNYLSLGYAEFLQKTKREPQAEKVLNQAIANSRDDEFVKAARYFYQTANIPMGEQFALSRLAEILPSPRRKISYNLQLAESFEEAGKRDAARNVLSKLVRNFPTNYGVITESANFYRRLGFENDSAQVLQNALPKAKGVYRSALAKKLADRLINLNRLDSAEKILSELHTENKTDEKIFRQLSRVCIRTGNSDLMRKAFDETVAEIKKTDDEPREINARIAGLRSEMIDAFTRLKDYKSAIDQHIEIINREPDDDQLTGDAIAYVQRYGGAEILLNYYLKLSEEAFKNYRWNVVLARIYAANNDTENAVKNYAAAIINQPEMPELYLAAAELETKRNYFDAALKNIDEVLILTNDAPENIKKKIEILKKAGRTEEAKIEQAKLPAEEKPALDRFAEAREAARNEKEKAREIYRQAFAELLENPLKNDLNAADITAYTNSVRETDTLDSINENLWTLREKLIGFADKENSSDAGEARKRLSTLENAMLDALGMTAKNFATDQELINLHENWLKKVEGFSAGHDTHASVSLIQDLSRRAGFGDLEEKILTQKIEREVSELNKRIYVRDLVNFYNERGLYQRTFEVIEKYGSDDLPLKAETAKLVGNREKELEALRAIYGKPFEKIETVNNENVSRYLEILQTENRDELKSLTEKQSAFQIQLVKFLIAKNERELAHSAIERSSFSIAWKAARHAEVSLALREFADENECYFCEALQFDSIGNLLAQTPDKKRFLINDDWFKLTRQYGEWLREKKISKAERDLSEADEYLPAMTENFPKSADEQLKLGAFYLERNEAEKAIGQFNPAIELDNFAIADKRKLSYLAAAYFLSGQTAKAEEFCQRVFDEGDEEYEGGREQIVRSLILFQTLQIFGQGEKVRGKLPPLIVEFLKNSDADKFEDFQNLIRSVAASFKNEAEKTEYFLKILEKRPTDKSLARMLIDENLVKEPTRFYELLIARSGDLYRYDYDYEFQNISNRIWTGEEAEAVYEQENDYPADEPESDSFYLRRRYLEILLEQKEDARAAKFIAETEKLLKGKYVRPAWLRAAKINLQIRAGRFDLPDAEKFIGIAVPDSAVKIIAPNLDRFNEITTVLKKEKLDAEELRLSEAFFARQIALENYDAANFSGLAETFFRQNESDKALQILRLTIAASDDATRENALREIALIDEIKQRAAEAAKIEKSGSSVNFNKTFALNLAAETAVKFGQKNTAIEFRRELLNLAPDEAENKIKLAEILISEGAKTEAFSILNLLSADRNALRSQRWQARKILREAGVNIEFPDLAFDVFSQYYNGIFAEKSNENNLAFQFFANAQIVEKDALTDARQHLIKLYALADKPFAALNLAITDNSAKSDELLQILSDSAEKVGNFGLAIQYEKAKSNGGNPERIENLLRLSEEKNRRATDFTVDAENTGKL